MIEPIVIVVDFDGTCVSHEFPLVGNDIGAVPVLQALVSAGHKLVLSTMRSNRDSGHLDDAVAWFEENAIPLYGVQENPTQIEWTAIPKAHGDIEIDDRALGCPLKEDELISDSPFVDWDAVRRMLEQQGVLPSSFIDSVKFKRRVYDILR